MKKEMTFAPLLLAGLLLSACSHSPAEKTLPYADISLGEFPASSRRRRIRVTGWVFLRVFLREASAQKT
ncbi:hypothetical protein EBC17_21075 [Salmonella enterica subsp. enterica serovar Kottbus]|nr:hypothetical protein [Salmonella enterica subsp. enterica serovar Kottbus]